MIAIMILGPILAALIGVALLEIGAAVGK